MDGRLDLLASRGFSSDMVLMVGNGTGGFSVLPFAIPTGNFVSGLAVADFNLDGRPDFAVTNFAGGNVSIMLHNGSGFSSAGTVGAGTNPNSAVTGDFNQDGKPDLAVSNVSSNDVTVLLGNGSG